MLKLKQTNTQTNQPTNQQTEQKQYGYKNITFVIHIMVSASPIGGHVFQGTTTIFNWDKLSLEKMIRPRLTAPLLIEHNTNVLTKFHADWTKNVPTKVLIRKTASTPGGNVFQHTRFIFKQCQDAYLTKMCDEWIKKAASRGLTSF
ncbi:hypothetical protein DPMN_103848 [Dreissena polymorpha]|uniref:Uncharacterized protein n=1 Tax=Dreissena polymorpha TaxID=45954 RepID=A0A9D4H8M8_DREPO|nr:hypothetical protein DPMN_103848 [Dreissena polymorpha]